MLAAPGQQLQVAGPPPGPRWTSVSDSVFMFNFSTTVAGSMNHVKQSEQGSVSLRTHMRIVCLAVFKRASSANRRSIIISTP